ncbi:hypothetical protein AIOL_004142 [Candidatus Rhodobacter oscarellae]|uniref:Lipoprotein n=1 Tax=Candidatus Rhodobacter oscarellae TaxID=1675527 RepID=A0A0J9E961_9RHOB|nr:hypothetical protein [Candidatus Rhodobacter lobularis]KMW59161.1 hypothetical protein AIOL_004142 [Candidatus Rhodobacter lobularis]
MRKILWSCTALLGLAALAGCAQLEEEPIMVEPVVISEAEDCAIVSEDGIGGTGCPAQDVVITRSATRPW